MSRRKEAVIPAELLDQLLAGTDAAAALDQGGALGIGGVGSSRSLSSMESLRTEFQAGNLVILWGPLARNPTDRFGHFILAIGVGTDGKIVAHVPYGGRRVLIDPVTRRVQGSTTISVVEKCRIVRL